MSKAQKVKQISGALFSLLCAFLLVLIPDYGHLIVLLLLSLSMLLNSIKTLLYYFTMARYMVGGRITLYKGIILLDLGLFALSLSDVHRYYIMCYLLLVYLFWGVLDLMRAFEARKLDAPSWKFKLGQGIAEIGIGALCIIFSGTDLMISYVYAAGLVYNAVAGIYSVFRKTAVIDIQ